MRSRREQREILVHSMGFLDRNKVKREHRSRRKVSVLSGFRSDECRACVCAG